MGSHHDLSVVYMFKAAVAQEVGGLPGDGGVGEHGGVVDGEDEVVAAVGGAGFGEEDGAVAFALQADDLADA